MTLRVIVVEESGWDHNYFYYPNLRKHIFNIKNIQIYTTQIIAFIIIQLNQKIRITGKNTLFTIIDVFKTDINC